MRSLCQRRIKTRGSTDNHGTESSHRNTVQVGCSFHYRCCPETQHGSGRVCGIFQCSGYPRWCSTSCFSIAKPHTTGDLRYELKASSIGDWYGQQKVGRTQWSPSRHSTLQTSRLAAMDSKCRRRPSSSAGSTKIKKNSSDEEQQ